MELAKHYGIDDYASPAGGCLLTDPIVSVRIRKLLAGKEILEVQDLLLMAVGRHFSLPGGQLFVGRYEKDNEKLEKLVRPADHVLMAAESKGPFALYRRTNAEPAVTEADLNLAARIVARYSGAKNDPEVPVLILSGGLERIISVAPAAEEEIEPLWTVY
jgi:hypothetical protein